MLKNGNLIATLSIVQGIHVTLYGTTCRFGMYYNIRYRTHCEKNMQCTHNNNIIVRVYVIARILKVFCNQIKIERKKATIVSLEDYNTSRK